MQDMNRRQFVGLATAAPLMASVSRVRYAYAGSAAGITVFQVDATDRWKQVQHVPSRRPAFLLFNRARTLLFAANAVSKHEGHPRGTVESYAVGSNGELLLRTRQPLSLSASVPHHLALTADEAHLLVTSFKGGAYNVLPVSSDGMLDAPVHILKETGRSVHDEWQACAHPHSLACHADEELILASDFGSDSISAFTFSGGKLQRQGRWSVPPGDGPGPTAFLGDGSRVAVLNLLSHSLSVRKFHSSAGTLGPELKRVSLEGNALAVRGNRIYVAGRERMSVWQLGSSLRLVQALPVSGVSDHGAVALHDGSIITIERPTGDIRVWKGDSAGQLFQTFVAARMPESLSIAVSS